MQLSYFYDSFQETNENIVMLDIFNDVLIYTRYFYYATILHGILFPVVIPFAFSR